MGRRLLALGMGALALAQIASARAAEGENRGAIVLDLPIECILGKDCFLQQLVDLDVSDGVSDPFCGTASYDGHQGTDIRVIYPNDISAGVSVLSSADGVVSSVRDGMADRLAFTAQEKERIGNRQCGNGVVVRHANGWETQYCHLRNGSVIAEVGQEVSAGDKIGEVGYSGRAQFPHVHMSVRKDGVHVDPFTGASIGQACSPDRDMSAGLWSPEAAEILNVKATQLLDAGLADVAVSNAVLRDGPPEIPTADSDALVGWIYLINVRAGDQVGVRVTGPDGEIYSQGVTKPLEKPNASYAMFAGRRSPPPLGDYKIEAMVIRDGELALHSTRQASVR
ncbi:MAG: M23 family metallopeptidase [Pseudomonadota bacterium]